MKTIFLIETDPINKMYFKDVHCGFINVSNSIEHSRQFKTYDNAQKILNDIVLNDYTSEKILYLSIVKFTVKNNA